jgi:probable F420-dependent oxidoreductase
MQLSSIEFMPTIRTFGPHASPTAFREVAQAAEAEGFAGVTVGEHVTFPERISESPFSESGDAPDHFDSSEQAYTALEVLSYLVALTEDLTLAMSMSLPSLHNPVEFTKEVFTVDALSAGRVDLGVAPGWLETEFEVLDVPFSERGARLDDFLQIFTKACSTPEFAYSGKTYSFQKTGFHPIPERDGGPPVWIGGTSGASLRRTAEFGEGFVVVWERPDEIADLRDRVMNAWRDFDRDGEPGIGVSRPFYVASPDESAPDRPFMGEPASIVADIEAFHDVGVTRFDLAFPTGDPAGQVEQLERFSDGVLASL